MKDLPTRARGQNLSSGMNEIVSAPQLADLSDADTAAIITSPDHLLPPTGTPDILDGPTHFMKEHGRGLQLAQDYMSDTGPEQSDLQPTAVRENNWAPPAAYMRITDARHEFALTRSERFNLMARGILRRMVERVDLRNG
jgi:hypothetical protein